MRLIVTLPTPYSYATALSEEPELSLLSTDNGSAKESLLGKQNERYSAILVCENIKI